MKSRNYFYSLQSTVAGHWGQPLSWQMSYSCCQARWEQPFPPNRSVSVGSSNKRSGAVGQMSAPREQKFIGPQCVRDARNCRWGLTCTHVFKPFSGLGRPTSCSHCHLIDETWSAGFTCSSKAAIAYHHKLEERFQAREERPSNLR